MTYPNPGYQQPPYPPPEATLPPLNPPERPVSLNLALTITVLAIVSALVGGISVFLGGDSAIRSLFDSQFRQELGLGPDTPLKLDAAGQRAYYDALDQVKATIDTRAWMLIILAVLLLLAVALSWHARTGARIYGTLMLILTAGAQVFILRDIGPTLLLAASGVVVVTSVLALLTWWTPGTNRYAREHKEYRRSLKQPAPPPQGGYPPPQHP